MSEAQTTAQPAISKPLQNRKKRGVGIYMQNVLTRKVSLPFKSIGSNLVENIEKYLSTRIEGKCVPEGFIKPKSIRIVNYSAGTVNGKFVAFTVVFECLICRPVEGMKFKAVVKNITKAGIRCETQEDPSPVVVFIARDHHFKSKEFSQLKLDDNITLKVIGIRFELNDPYISVIAEYVPPRKIKAKKPIKILINPKK
jgi:DNA-directed RNA polymerase subunit E'/Rpb7